MIAHAALCQEGMEIATPCMMALRIKAASQRVFRIDTV